MITYVIYNRRDNLFLVVNEAHMLIVQKPRVSGAVENVVATFESIKPKKMQKFFYVIVESATEN
jgi:hypothetical protein